MKYEYKVVIVVDHNLDKLDSYLADGWEVFLVTSEVVTSQYFNRGAIFFTIRKEIN